MRRVDSSIGAPSTLYRSLSSHPVPSSHGSTRNVVGSGAMTMSRAPMTEASVGPPSDSQILNA